ncbi:MAG: succinylglutamate desuccinylase/aspartoacylase family protein [Alphaproteobacteria bacterium]|nr:succinylglutamate desuccinylase/aspartoacylase family protein [Alphaproteobacteria bacterium]
MLDIYEFDSGVEGEHFLVLGAVHGNEECGPESIYKVIEKFQSGALSLQQGRVTFVPICNPEAYAHNTRFMDRDLNRFMSPIENPSVYEDYITNVLCPLLEEADVLLDLHSNRAGGAPFVFIEHPDGEEVPFAMALGADHMVYGFANAYKNAENDVKESMGTREYFRLSGGRGVTLECGQNGDPKSIEFAEQAIISAMKYFSLIEGGVELCVNPRIVEIQSSCLRPDGARFVCDVFNCSAFGDGDIIARDRNGAPSLRADGDIVIFFPQPIEETPAGEDWFHLGKTVGKRNFG